MEIQRRQGQGQNLAQWLAAFLSPGPSPGPGPHLHPASADQQGRWSLPGGRRHSGRLGVGGWRLDEAAPGAIDSALDAALCTLSLSGRADRPRSAVFIVDALNGWPVGRRARSQLALICILHQRTSRDAGPYLEAEDVRGGWGLAVGG